MFQTRRAALLWTGSPFLIAVVLFAVGAVGAVGVGVEEPAGAQDQELERRVRAVLAEVPLIDGHNDVPWAYRRRVKNKVAELDFASDLSGGARPMHTDLPRLREGGVGGQFWSVYTPTSTGGPGAARYVFEQIDFVHRLVAAHPDQLQLAFGADDIVEAHAAGKIASLMGMEGGHCIENSLGVLRTLYAAGARYMTLAHSANTDWAASCTGDEVEFGLTEFGKEIVREMNRMGMLVDISHVTPKAMHDALDVTAAPAIFSHSSARAVCDHVRNVPDDVLQRLPENGGLVMITWVPSFVSEEVRTWPDKKREADQEIKKAHPGDVETIERLTGEWVAANPRPVATLGQVADHIEHVRRVAGIDHVGVGGDLDGTGALPVGLEDCSTYPALMVELARRGWSDEDLGKFAGQNLLRVFRGAEAVAARLQQERPASDKLIEDLDPIIIGDEDKSDG